MVLGYKINVEKTEVMAVGKQKHNKGLTTSIYEDNQY